VSEGKIIARAALVIVIMTVFSRVSGFLREVAIAHQFGATAATDAYVLAYTLPFLAMMAVGGAITATVVPLFTEYAARRQVDEAWRLFSRVLNGLILVLAAAVCAGVLLAPQLVAVMAPGFAGETADLAAKLVKIMLPSLIFMVLGNLFMGLLNANNIFGPSAAGPAVMNTIIIAAALTVGGVFGISGLAAGTVTGAVLAALVQVPFLLRAGFRWHPVVSPADPGVHKLLTLMLPVLATSGISQGYFLVERMLASGLDEGSIAALNYANKLVLLPQGLFVFAVSTAIFPTLSRLVSEHRREDMARILSRGVKLVFMIAVPAGVGLMVLREPVISLLFERGAFDQRAVDMTASALLYYSIGLAGLSVNPLLVRGLFALQDMWAPLKSTAVMVAANIALALLLVDRLQHGGLALAYSLAVTLNMLILAWLLRRKVPGFINRQLVRFLACVLLAGVPMALLLQFVDPLVASRLGEGGAATLARLLVDAVLGMAAYLLAACLLKLDELQYIAEVVKKRLCREKLPQRQKEKI